MGDVSILSDSMTFCREFSHPKAGKYAFSGELFAKSVKFLSTSQLPEKPITQNPSTLLLPPQGPPFRA